jgi:hypothetical protein
LPPGTGRRGAVSELLCSRAGLWRLLDAEVLVRALLFLVVALLAPACARPDYGESRPDWLLLSAGAQPGYAIKRVVEKVPPATLVGDDGSICPTSLERYETTREGSWTACAWTLRALDDTTALAKASP